MPRKMPIDGEVNQASHVEEDAHFDFDLFVIGAGSGGVRAARFSANYGAKVGICELPFHPISSEVNGGVGGTCVLRGCVPKKILVYGANFGGEIEDARNYGWEINEKVDFNWKKLLQKKSDEIVRLNGIYKRLLSNAGVKLYEGEGKVAGPNEVELTQLDGTKLKYSAKHILIATGSKAQRPDIPGQELGITSDEALSLEDFPKRVLVLGGGYIAVEFASIWRGMGATVDLFFRRELPLRGFDDEMRAVVARNLEGRGINLHPRTNLTELTKTEDGIKVRTDHGEELLADVVLFATGRAPNTKRLNLEAVGVELDKTGAVKVDEFSRTNIPSIWAAGDVTNRMNLTPVALMEGSCFAKTVFAGQPTKPDYNHIPYAVFSIPPLSVVGLSEEQALDQANGDVLIFTSTFNPMKNTISGRQEKTVMKLVVDAETDKVLGASMCGPDAPEIMHLSLKIYVYEEDEIDGLKELLRGREGKISADACVKGQWGTQVKIHKLLLQSRFRTRKKEEANLFFVPAYAKCVRMMGGLNDKEINHTYVKALSQMPYFRRSGGRDHIFVFPSGAGAHLFRSWATYINRSIILTPEGDRTDKKDTSSFNTWKDVIIPGNVEDGMTKRGAAMAQPLPLSKRKYLANYLGRAQGKVGRLKLIELAKQYPDKECVPVILSDQAEFPFQNVIDYTQISIKWPSTRIGLELLEYLESIPDEDVERMIAAGRQVRCLWVYAPELESCSAMQGIMWELQRKVRQFHQSAETFWLHNRTIVNRNMVEFSSWKPPMPLP